MDLFSVRVIIPVVYQSILVLILVYSFDNFEMFSTIFEMIVYEGLYMVYDVVVFFMP